MSDFFELFNPGLRHQREQRDLEKILVVDDKKGGTGPRPLDLDSGSVVLQVPGRSRGMAEAHQTTAYPSTMDQAPLAPLPDDKDWTIVLTQPCAECGYDAASIEVARLPHLVRDAAAPWRAVLSRADAAQRPAPQVWSPLEYACHVRDLLTIFTGRLALMLAHDDPAFEDWDQDATALKERYWAQDPAVVAAGLAAAAEANAAGWDQVGEDDWRRRGLRSNGSRFTVDSLGRYLLHDLRHHLWDVGA